uniref:Cytochrome c oxidase subunit 2 n=1 Tax=Asobara japonica TaxID=554476 RepID=A0A6B9XRG9_9HYME|nr:cytochrome c oxidase subunit II [Asobara japonica]QHR84917.1 cytochrome oxidase subunit 2 [Asobara japonica]
MWYMMNFQDFNSFLYMYMIEFHDLSLMILLMILFFIMYIIIMFMYNLMINKNILHNQIIEIIWTMIPMVILIFMAIPSLKILYWMEDDYDMFFITMKILGHQWYWSYEYSDFKDIEFDSFMMTEYMPMSLRLLDVDNRLILPVDFYIRGMVSSLDVIHSWAMPVMGVKIDAIPGRINQFIMNINYLGIYFGQCSEICGLNHSFMPIVLEVMPLEMFLDWANKN